MLALFLALPAQGEVQSAALEPATARLAGTVTAPEPFTAAQVYAWNRDRNMLYMVFTSQGRYAAPKLVAGAYELWAEKGLLRSAHRMLRIEAGQSVTVDHVLAPGPDFALTLKDPSKGGPQFGSRPAEGAKIVGYDEMYPPERARETAEKTCMRCHGQAFLPGQRYPRAQWRVLIDAMLNAPPGRDAAAIKADAVSVAEREALADYLAKYFGPDSPARVLKIDAQYPLDEAEIAKGMYVEYLLPLLPGLDPLKRSENEPGKHRLHRPYLDGLGNIWASNGLIGVTRLDPRTAQVSHYPFGTDDTNYEIDMYGRKRGEPGSIWQYIFPHDITVDTDHNVWWAEFQGRHIGRLEPATGRMTRFPIDPNKKVVDEVGNVGNPRGHTPRPDSQGNIWFTVIRGNKIGKWDRKTEKITLWEIPSPHSFPYGLIVTPEDKLWFAELMACNVTFFDPVTEKFVEHKSPSAPCAINRLAADSKGIVWYSVFSGGKLGRIDPKTGEVKEYDVRGFTRLNVSAPYGIIADQQDRIWFGDGGLGGALVRFDPTTERFTYYPQPRQGDNPGLDLTRDGAIVYTTRSSNQAAIGIFWPDVSRMSGYGAFR
jgi:streptogramin lyase